MSRIHVHIDRLVLKGMSSQEAAAFKTALESSLADQLMQAQRSGTPLIASARPRVTGSYDATSGAAGAAHVITRALTSEADHG